MTSHEGAPPSRDQERVVAEFRARGGKVGGYHADMQLLLLTTTGARTGQRRAVPLTYLPDGDLNADPLLASVDAGRRDTLVCVSESGRAAYRFDIHLQGPNETVFLAHRGDGR